MSRNGKRILGLALVGGLLGASIGRLTGQEAQVTALMTRPLPDLPGKEALMIMVEYPPGTSEQAHRHNAHAFLYVLEGAVVMQVKGGSPDTVTAGETYYEGLGDIHLVGRNASNSRRARFLVVLLKKAGAPVVQPAQ